MSDRQPLLNLLAEYRAASPDEAAVVDRITALAEQHANCLDRDCRPGHLTGSAWVVSADGSRHLLLLHKKLGKWLQPGGHADGQTDLSSVALREAEEESGLSALQIVPAPSGLLPLDVDVHDIPARRNPDGSIKESAHEHHDVRFLLRTTQSEAITLSEESDDLRWCSAEEVRSLTQEESVLRLLKKAQKRLNACKR